MTEAEEAEAYAKIDAETARHAELIENSARAVLAMVNVASDDPNVRVSILATAFGYHVFEIADTPAYARHTMRVIATQLVAHIDAGAAENVHPKGRAAN